MTDVALATEDELSEAVGLKLLSEHHALTATKALLLRRNGYGYLRSRMPNWRQMAGRQIVVVITDLDRIACPLALLDDWLGAGRPCPRNLLLRVAVHEIESWLLADHAGMRNLLGKRGRLPERPDELADPKQTLLSLAQKAPRPVKVDLIAEIGAVAQQGLGYNRRLVDWVHAEWSPQRASVKSPSLSRARRALRDIAEELNELD